MILVAGVAALIVVVVVLVGLALGFTASRPGGGASLLPIAGGGLLLMIGGAVLVGVVGVDGDDDAAPSASRSVTGTRPVSTTTSTAPSRPGDLGMREVAVHANPGDDFAPVPPVVERLPRRAVLYVTATGFEPFSTGRIEQCSASGCGNGFPFDVPESGTARLQYLVAREFSTSAGARSSCSAEDLPCVVRVSSGGAAAYVNTVFGGAAPPPPSVTVANRPGGFVDGDAVLVTVRGFGAGERVEAMLCAAPATAGRARCGAPGPVAPFEIDADGTGRTSLILRRARVGTEGVLCGRETACAIAVVTAGGIVPGPVFPVTFAKGPTASYDMARLVAGLLVAAVLLGAAAFFARTTDWRKPTEAETPELDRAVL